MIDQSNAQGQKGIQYSRAKIFFGDKTIDDLGGLGVPVDHGRVKEDVYIISDFSERSLRKIEKAGFSYDILIEDVKQFYKNRNRRDTKADQPSRKSGKRANQLCGYRKNYPTPDGFSLGSMGGFFTYQEMLGHLDSMAARYPHLITQRQKISNDTTHNGHHIYYLKISDQPQVNEQEPEILYTGLHHAREPASLSNLIFYMYYLLVNYASDPAIQYLVDNTEMYFVPCVNPDGYIYNQQTDPNGGGMWRKNRRDNGDGTYGVDLNRNYGYKWGYDDNGSSPDPSSAVYRGDSAFSEPETQMMRQFTINHNFRMALNYHTYSNLLIYPWGYEDSFVTSDSSTFRHHASHITKDNNYLFGTGDETVGYTTNGGSDDWMYGEQSAKNKILAMTPEVGSLGFWPPASEIIRQCKDNMWQNIRSAFLLHNYGQLKDRSPMLTDTLANHFTFQFERLGLDSGQFQITMKPLDQAITDVQDTITYDSLALLEERRDTLSYRLDSCLLQGQSYRFETRIDNGALTLTDTVTRYFGNTQTALSDRADNLANWQTNGWQTTSSQSVTGSQSFTDSPNGNYANNTKKSITLGSPIDLRNAERASLSFWTRWEIESGFDYVQLQVSTDNGNSWQPLCGEFTRAGTPNQDEAQPLYDGNQKQWVKETINLHDYVGDEVLLRFQIVTDQYTTKDGFYFDDIRVTKIPASKIIASDSVICKGDEVTFQQPPFYENPYWVIDQQTVDTTASFTYNFNETGTYTTQLLQKCNGTFDTAASRNIIVQDSVSAAPFTVTKSGISIDVSHAVSNSTFQQWSFGDGAMSDQANPSHTYAEAGSYEVCLTTGNACDTVTNCKTVNVDPVGIATQGNRFFQIAPQPAQTSITITWIGEHEHMTLTLRNLLGEKVREKSYKSLADDQVTLSTTSLEQGLYILTGQTPGKRFSQKVVITD